MFPDLFLVCVDFSGLVLQQAGRGEKSLPLLPLPAFRAQFGKDRGIRYEGKTLTHTQPLPSKPLLPSLAASSDFGYFSLSPFAQSSLGLSFPAAKEDKLSVFPKVKKLNCAFMAEEL